MKILKENKTYFISYENLNNENLIDIKSDPRYKINNSEKHLYGSKREQK
jgi:hypothetical protein